VKQFISYILYIISLSGRNWGLDCIPCAMFKISYNTMQYNIKTCKKTRHM